MTWLRAGSRRSRRVAAGAAAVLAVVLLPGIASADTTGGPPTIQGAWSRDATLTVSTQISLMNRVLAGVDMTFVCQPFQSFDWETGQTTTTTAGELYGEVTVLQAAGRTLSSGVGSASGTAVCDGSTVNHLHVDVAPGSGLFKRGSAVVGAWVSAGDIASFQDSDAASSGALSARIG